MKIPLLGLAFLALCIASPVAHADVLGSYQFGPNSATAAGVPQATVTGANVAAADIAGLSGGVLDYSSPATKPTSAPYLRMTFTTLGTTAAAAVTNNAGYSFTITANAGYVLNLTSLNFDAMRGGAATPRGYVVRSSADGFAANLATADLLTARPTFTNVNVSLTGSAFQNLGAITFRIYGYSPATGSSVDFDNLTVNGAAAAIATGYVWSGATSANWDFSSTNWTGQGNIFSNGVAVLFTDTATGPTAVTVAAGGVSPLSVGVGNSGLTYSFNNGNVAVTNGLSKTGTGLFTINNTLSAGAVQVDGGTLALSSTGALTAPTVSTGSAGTLTVAAGSNLASTTDVVANGAVTFNNASQTLLGLDGSSTGVVTLNGTSLTVTGTSSYGGKLTGSGALVKNTGGVLTLSGTTSDFTGGTTVTGGGSLRFNSPTATGPAMLRVETGSNLALGADPAATTSLTLAGGTMGSSGAAHNLNADLTAAPNTVSTIIIADPLLPATSLETVMLGALHGSGTLAITAATTQGDPNGGGGVRFRNVTTTSDFTGLIDIKNGAKLEIRSAGGAFSALGVAASLRLNAGISGLTIATGAYSQLNLRTDLDTAYGHNVSITGTGFVNIFSASITAGIVNHTSALGVLTIGDQQTLASNSGGSVGGYQVSFSGVQLNGGMANFSPGHPLTAFGGDLVLGPVGELVGGSGFVKAGTNALILTAANSYTGTTQITSGTLRLGAAGALPAASWLQVDGGTLDLNNAGASNDQTVRGLSGSGGTITNSDPGNPRTLAVNQASGSASYAGSINDSLGLTKMGNGLLILAGVNTYSGPTRVLGGTLCVTGTIDATSSLSIAAGATFCVDGNTLNVTAPIVNNGTIRIAHGGKLAASTASSFTNNGILDLLGGTATLPPNFTNGPNGIVVDASTLNVKTIARANNVISLLMDSYSSHTYQLQRSTTLNGDFVNVGAAQNGSTGSVLSFSYDDVTAPRGFYRIMVDLPPVP